MSTPRGTVRAAVVLGVVTLLASCTFGSSPVAATSPRGPVGGTLKLGMTYVPWYAMDPAVEYASETWELLRCCLVRTLMSYDGTSGPSGTIPQPDLADGPPQVSADGLTWTFKLRHGLHYAPPLQNVEITAPDFIRALMRFGTQPAEPCFPSSPTYMKTYLGLIEGFDAYASGKSPNISGLADPDPYTLTITERSPDTSLADILALPITSPIPPLPDQPQARDGVAHGHAPGDAAPDSGYGRYLVSSGPYMFAGSEALNFSLPPGRQLPVLGFRPATLGLKCNLIVSGSMDLVRNPSWSPANDQLRPALADRIEVTLGDDGTMLDRVARGDFAMVFDASPDHATLNADPELRSLVVRTNDTLEIDLAEFNLAQPPFDDVAVRLAVSAVLDRATLAAVLQRTCDAGKHGGAQPSGAGSGGRLVALVVGSVTRERRPRGSGHRTIRPRVLEICAREHVPRDSLPWRASLRRHYVVASGAVDPGIARQVGYHHQQGQIRTNVWGLPRPPDRDVSRDHLGC